MANITHRKNKNGTISYRIRVFNSKNYKTESLTWKPDKNMTPKQIERQLQKQVIAFEEKVTNGKKSNEKITFKSFAENWLINRKPSVELKTYETYTRDTTLLIKAFENYKMSNITSTDISRFYDNLRKNGSNKRTGGRISENSIKHIHIILNMILECAIDIGIINKNPLKERSFSKPKKEEKDPVFLKEEEIKTLINELKNANIKWKTIIYLLLFSGMRRGESLALEWQDINLETGQIRINKNLQYVHKIGIIEKQPKTYKSNRYIFIPKECIELLKEYKQWQDNEKKKLGNLWQDTIVLKDKTGESIKKKNDKIFTQEYGQPMFPDSPTSWLNNFCAEHKIKITPHGLRHVYVSILTGAGLPVNVISQAVGHSNPAITLNVYTHLFEKDKTVVSETISNAINKIMQ